MTPEKKRKLRNIALLSLVGLIGGTFAFQAFNQQAINDRENEVQVHVGGRVHDYYNRDTENKDVFVENYGERPIMARIRLSEYLETQQTSATSPTPLVEGTEREAVNTWTPYIPSAAAIGTRTGAGAAFNRYSNLSFGWSRAGQSAPWYLPTFNHNNLDLSTAAAGDAQDLAAGSPEVTHPGDGTDAYWTEGVTYTNGENGTTWHGAADGATRTTAQNLQQERAPITMAQWFELPNNQKIGNFWVMDQETGWAYWASVLEPEAATSYLLDAAEMTSAIEDTVFSGTYYYGIHVDSQLLSPDNSEDFINDGETHDSNLAALLEGIKNNAVDETVGNPAHDVDSPPSDFAFHRMSPGRIFTMSGQQYRYLENMGNGNHMIIRNDLIRERSWDELDETLESWYEALDPAVQAMVQPVANSFTTGEVADDAVTFTGGTRWIPTNLEGAVASDITQVVPSGTARAFALSLADVTRLSGPGLAFPNHAQRSSAALGWWLLRTPAPEEAAWSVRPTGNLTGLVERTASTTGGGVRPALILHQARN
ncbi:hypothetical protein F4V47_02105 [Lactococcus garvieae subsp. garvieae]|uniref:hypothetical protein n=1 Tax=Lactococcus garvieae TaxID=1363 RepID=UPI0005A6C68E|nr:hypothetical protein [Lactococcus garvieae]KAA8718372.1 hypothetical protein F4V47_02105 [Lactococcus garvieae subsp. garvieae]MDG6190698.1 hypothetical protein [Lactococcus garvieae]PCS03455.1 hypothetical protein RU85_GL000813 [Lactococcus garvieae]QPR48868.1 hypothetical protein I6G86_09975 [Lactococcus garvieae]